MDKAIRTGKVKTKAIHILSVIIGLIIIFIVGFSLFPVLKFIIKMSFSIQNYYSFLVKSILYEFFWLGIASFLGGFVTTSISKTVFHALLTGSLAAIIILGMGIFINRDFSMLTLLAAAGIFFFCLMGGLVQKYLYIKKSRK